MEGGKLKPVLDEEGYLVKNCFGHYYTSKKSNEIFLFLFISLVDGYQYVVKNGIQNVDSCMHVYNCW